MPSYLERYLSGEHEQVWTELTAHGERIYTEPLFADAQAVARETMSRARANIELLIPRLESIGYRFGHLPDSGHYWAGHPAWVPPGEGAAVRLDELENLVGPLPLALRAWMEMVGAVNFVGFHPAWPAPEILDPLYVDAVSGSDGEDGYFGYIEECYHDWMQDREEYGSEPFTLELAPDEYHKANISGGDGYSIELPCRAMDAPLLNEWHATTFTGYLRACFRWGGFPGFERCTETKRPHEHLEFLTAGLPPL